MPALRAPVARISEDFASALVWELFDKPRGHPDRKQIHDDPILDLLRSPHLEIEPFSFWRLIQIWRELAGEAFIAVDTFAGRPSRLTPIAPHWITSTPTAERPTFQTCMRAASGMIEIPSQNVIWLRDLDPMDPFGRGSGVAASLVDELDTDEYAAQYVRAWFQNGGVPDYIISAKGARKEDVEAAREKWEARYRGPKSAHQTHWASGELAVHEIGHTFKDQELNELRRSIRDRCNQTWGLPPEKLGIIENSNRTTIEAAEYFSARSLLVPRMETLCGQFQLRLIPMYGRKDRFLSFKSPVPDDLDRTLRAMAVFPPAFDTGELRGVAGMLPGPRANEPLTAGSAVATETQLPKGRIAGDPAWTASARLELMHQLKP